MSLEGMRGELIGRRVQVKGSQICGTIIDETQHMLIIEASAGIRRVQKKGHSFAIDGVDVEGASLHGKPHERARIKVTYGDKRKGLH